MIALPAAAPLLCPDCGYTWPRLLVACGRGPVLLDHRCHHCRLWFRIGYRVGDSTTPTVHLVGVVESQGEGLAGLRKTLPLLFGFTDEERAQLMAMAEAFGVLPCAPRRTFHPRSGR